MNAVAGLGGPVAAAYGVSRSWGKAMVPNMAIFLLVSSLAVLGARGWPQETAGWQVMVLMVAAATGVWLGGQCSRLIPDRWPLALTVIVAGTGAVIAIVRGALSLWH